MNDLDLMKRFRADTEPADPATLARARARMTRPEPDRLRPDRLSARARLAWRIAPAAALTAAVAVAVVVTRPGDEPTRPSTSTSATAEPIAGLNAPAVFRLAAAEAKRAPLLTARPDQYVYTESLTAYATAALDDQGEHYQPPTEQTRRIWLSVDGKRDGLLEQKPSDPHETAVPDLSDEPVTAYGSPSYRTDLPTDAAAMRAWLYRGERGDQPADRAAFTLVGDTLREEYVPPAATAALFEAAATIPGTNRVTSIDLAGRRGVAVSRADGDIQEELIFDATTYRFLGERQVVSKATASVPAGEVIGWSAQLKVAIVDRPGELP